MDNAPEAPRIPNQRVHGRWLSRTLAALLVSAGVGVITILTLLRQPVGVETPAPRIPASAVWHGGRPGGTWIDLVETSGTDRFRIRVYADFTAELERDAWFVVTVNCRERSFPKEKFHEWVKEYDGNRFHIQAGDGAQLCYLDPWNASKEKQIAVQYELERLPASKEEFDAVKVQLQMGKEFHEGELNRSVGKGRKTHHDKGLVQIREATHRRTGRKYQYSIETFEDHTTYSIQALRK